MLLELEVEPVNGESFSVYHWSYEQNVYEDDGDVFYEFTFYQSADDVTVQEDEDVQMTLRADGVVTTYDAEVASVGDTQLADDTMKVGIVTELQPLPDDAPVGA